VLLVVCGFISVEPLLLEPGDAGSVLLPALEKFVDEEPADDDVAGV